MRSLKFFMFMWWVCTKPTMSVAQVSKEYRNYMVVKSSRHVVVRSSPMCPEPKLATPEFHHLPLGLIRAYHFFRLSSFSEKKCRHCSDMFWRVLDRVKFLETTNFLLNFLWRIWILNIPLCFWFLIFPPYFEFWIMRRENDIRTLEILLWKWSEDLSDSRSKY